MSRHDETYALWELVMTAHLMRKERLSFPNALARVCELRVGLIDLANALDGAEGAANVGHLQRTTWALVDALDDEDRHSAELPEVIEVLALAGK